MERKMMYRYNVLIEFRNSCFNRTTPIREQYKTKEEEEKHYIEWVKILLNDISVDKISLVCIYPINVMAEYSPKPKIIR